jgi:hypothetical protein
LKAKKLHFIHAKIVKPTKRGNVSFYSLDRETKKLKWARLWLKKREFNVLLRSSLGFQKKKVVIGKQRFNKYFIKRTIHKETIKLKEPREKFIVSNIIYTKGQSKIYNKFTKKGLIPLSRSDEEIKKIAKSRRKNLLGLNYKESSRKFLKQLTLKPFIKREHKESP